MLAGGVGISPMIQIVRAMLNIDAPRDMYLVWGAVKSSQLVYRPMLDQRAADASNRLHVTYVLEHPPADAKWCKVGFITESILRESIPRADPGVRIVICGPPVMCNVIKKTLTRMGYPQDIIFSFL